MEVSALLERFRQEYPGAGDASVCRAPGRVNLIGEHTDYNGLPVLPIAIAQEIRIAYRGRADGKVSLRDVDPDFDAITFENGPVLPPSESGAWENYCKAALHGINKELHVTSFPGADLLVSSTLPIAAGLSSSSALVVACALVYLDVLGCRLDHDISRLRLAELLADAEHYVGTRGGGMDQGVILNGDHGHACKIDFFPLRVEVAPLPDDCVIVVCDSMVKVKKSGEALNRYNAGPRSCALACAMVERQIQEEFGESVELQRLGDLWFGPLCLTHREAEELCARAIPQPRLSLNAAADRLRLSPAEVRERWLGDLPEPQDGFPLQARLRHQLTEFRRVETARDALLANDAKEFGRLMNASHDSCAQDFGISGPELDTLVAAARNAGALGSRLTGAGFGGATVSLIQTRAAAGFIEQVTQEYYRRYRGYAGVAPIFMAHASEGAGYL